jgi:hypothetical protein
MLHAIGQRIADDCHVLARVKLELVGWSGLRQKRQAEEGSEEETYHENRGKRRRG